MSDKKYIIFDLDGTLIDSRDTVVRACRQALDRLQNSAMADNGLFSIFGPNDMERLFETLAQMAVVSPETFRSTYDKAYAQDCITGSTVIQTQYDVLTKARANGIGVIIITNKKQDIAEEVCRKLLDLHADDIIIGRHDARPIKPGHVIADRLRVLGINPGTQCLRYYGDSDADAETAKLLNVEYINIKIN